MKGMWKVVPVMFIAGCLLLGCGNKTMAGKTGPSMTVRASADRVFVGDTVTLNSTTENLPAKESRIEWHSPTGKLSPAENGRLARVVFDTPGTYSVEATLIVDGREVKRDSVTIYVKPRP